MRIKKGDVSASSAAQVQQATKPQAEERTLPLPIEDKARPYEDTRPLSDPAALAAGLKAQGVGVPTSDVVTWPLQEREEIARWLVDSAKGLTTKFPARLRQFLPATPPAPATVPREKYDPEMVVKVLQKNGYPVTMPIFESWSVARKDAAFAYVSGKAERPTWLAEVTGVAEEMFKASSPAMEELFKSTKPAKDKALDLTDEDRQAVKNFKPGASQFGELLVANPEPPDRVSYTWGEEKYAIPNSYSSFVVGQMTFARNLRPGEDPAAVMCELMTLAEEAAAEAVTRKREAFARNLGLVEKAAKKA